MQVFLKKQSVDKKKVGKVYAVLNFSHFHDKVILCDNRQTLVQRQFVFAAIFVVDGVSIAFDVNSLQFATGSP